ncbi:DUF4097 domain-containing protein [Romboutsia lituseburensis]|uniref:DUF4097 domain-containing protein n=1 Tax=Romboutsia lituseburensis TaxID=1537 RepID=UPI00215AADD5|nr:DUF4097 domain-containing protein [Romboutsia lituseburensis]MCR8745065.1 DUF4097 domain-containing protein [Romboutsia lituseburensis]
MKDMNKKITIVAIVLIVIGIIGSISFGIASVPYFINMASQIEQELNKETVIFNKEINITKLNINTNGANIKIKKHDKEEIIITKKGSSKNESYDISNSENELLITQNKNNNNYVEFKDINDVVDLMVGELYLYNANTITIYVSKNIDINATTGNGTLMVEEDILLDTLNFKTITGNISLPKKVKSLNDLNITSKNYIQMSVSELLGIKNINIIANSVNIYSDEQDIFIDNIEEYLPENMDIIQTNNEYGDITINVDIPVAKNLVVNAKQSSTELDLPIEKYNINLDLKSIENIDFSELIERNKIDNKEISKLQNTRELNFNLNENLKNNEKKYKMQVKSNFISVR